MKTKYRLYACNERGQYNPRRLRGNFVDDVSGKFVAKYTIENNTARVDIINRPSLFAELPPTKDLLPLDEVRERLKDITVKLLNAR